MSLQFISKTRFVRQRNCREHMVQAYTCSRRVMSTVPLNVLRLITDADGSCVMIFFGLAGGESNKTARCHEKIHEKHDGDGLSQLRI